MQFPRATHLHGPMVFVDGAKTMKKAYLMAIIDDHSRLIVHASFYLSETYRLPTNASGVDA